MADSSFGTNTSLVENISPEKQKLIDLIKKTLEGEDDYKKPDLEEKRKTLIEIMPEDQIQALWVTCERYREVVDPKVGDGAVTLLSIVFKVTELAVSQALIKARLSGGL